MNRQRGATGALIAAMAAFGLATTSCSESGFRIKGDVEGADNELVLLEKADFGGRWIVLDSVRSSKSGRFTIKHDAPDSPEIYRIRIGNGFAYIPVDSTETVSLTANGKDFAGTWTLTGSGKAEDITAFEKEFRAFLPHSSKPDSASAFKRRVYSKYLQDTKGSVVSYYVLTKTIDETKPLFDPKDRGDLRIFSAVATSFKEYVPDDPRTPLLENTVINARRVVNSAAGKKLVVEAEEAALLPIALPDENGRTVSLSEVAGKGKPTVLMFGIMANAGSVAANHALAELIRMRGGDLAIYSVSFDTDPGIWRESARNVPWTTVLDHNATSSVAVDYNVSQLPAFFIIDRAGNLVDRTQSVEEVPSLVRKHS